MKNFPTEQATRPVDDKLERTASGETGTCACKRIGMKTIQIASYLLLFSSEKSCRHVAKLFARPNIFEFQFLWTACCLNVQPRDSRRLVSYFTLCWFPWGSPSQSRGTNRIRRSRDFLFFLFLFFRSKATETNVRAKNRSLSSRKMHVFPVVPPVNRIHPCPN